MIAPAHTIVDASVVHRRLRPRNNAFRYRVAYLCLGLDALENAGGRWLKLDRRGTFSPNVDIAGYNDVSDLGGARMGHRGLADNCASTSTGVAALPILAARFASYRIIRVDYADGTSWPP